jgi:hypothetical protein
MVLVSSHYHRQKALLAFRATAYFPFVLHGAFTTSVSSVPQDPFSIVEGC